MREQIARHATKDPFGRTTMAIGATDQKVGGFGFGGSHELLGHHIGGHILMTHTGLDTVTTEVCADIARTVLVSPKRYYRYAFRGLQEG